MLVTSSPSSPSSTPSSPENPKTADEKSEWLLPSDIIYLIMSCDFATLAKLPLLCRHFAQKYRVVQLNCDTDFDKLMGENRILSIDASTYKIEQGLKKIEGLRVRYLKLENAYKINGSHLRLLNGLETLDLTNCDQFEWKWLEGLDEVKNLVLKGCKIGDGHLEFVKGMKKLKTLDLTGCHLTDDGLSKLALPKLYSLNVSDCQNLSPALGESIKAMPCLRGLDVSGCWKFSAVKEKVFFPGIGLIQ